MRNDNNKNLDILKKRKRELDLARGFSVLFVIATHVDLFAEVVFKRLFYNFPVPFFFFASAFSLTLRYQNKEKIDLKQFYKSRFHFNLIAYFIYAFIIIFLQNLQEFHFSFNAFIVYYFTNALLGNVQTIWNGGRMSNDDYTCLGGLKWARGTKRVEVHTYQYDDRSYLRLTFHIADQQSSTRRQAFITIPAHLTGRLIGILEEVRKISESTEEERNNERT